MDFIEIAELISAYAALLTVILALIELSNRSYSKKAERSTLVYSKFLNAKQEIDFIYNSFNSLLRNLSLNPRKIQSYAKIHIVTSETLNILRDLEEECINQFSDNQKTANNKSIAVFNWTSNATQMIYYVNTVYNYVIDNENFVINEHSMKAEIDTIYNKTDKSGKTLGEILHSNLKTTRSSSNRYIIFLIVAAVIFLAILLSLNLYM